MIPSIVLTATYLIFSIAGELGAKALREHVIRLRLSVAALFLVTASAHFGSLRPDLVRMGATSSSPRPACSSSRAPSAF